MHIQRMKELLDLLKGLDINELGIFVDDEEADTKNSIRAISVDRTTVAFTDIEPVVDVSIGIVSVKGLASRLGLFDEEKMGVTYKTSERKQLEYINELTVKEGRRRSKVITTDPRMLTIPPKYPEGEPVFALSFTKEYIDFLNKMNMSIGSTAQKEEVYFELGFDRETEEGKVLASINSDDDDFEELIDIEKSDDYDGELFSVQWKIDSLLRVLKKAASVNDEKVDMVVCDTGMLEIDCNGTTISIAPKGLVDSRSD